MTLQSIIKQRHGAALDWETEIGLSYVPEKGEVCWYSIPVPPQVNDSGEIVKSFPDEVVFKVGDGIHSFEELPFGQAKAADVYAWAKQEETDFLQWKSLQAMIDARVEQYLTSEEFIIDANYIEDEIGDTPMAPEEF